MSRKITRTFSVGVGWKGVKPSGTSKTRRRKPPSKVKRDAERMQSFIQQKQLQQEVPFVRGETLRPATTAFVRSPAGTLVRLIPRRPPPSGAGLTGGGHGHSRGRREFGACRRGRKRTRNSEEKQYGIRMVFGGTPHNTHDETEPHICDATIATQGSFPTGERLPGIF